MHEWMKVAAGWYVMRPGYAVKREGSKWYVEIHDQREAGPFSTLYGAKRWCRDDRRQG